MDRIQQAEILGKLFSAESGTLKHAKPPETAGSRPWDHWSAPVLLERIAYLQKLAKFGDGTASEELKSFPRYSAMLSVRLRSSGTLEISEEFAQLFIVLEGRATMVKGDEIEQGSRTGKVEDAAINNGSKQELRAGDVVHIAAGTPYQMLIAGERTLGCLVIRIKETKNPDSRTTE
jgi:mannose-6-phosphate isomerase-like protein (cupin superfamily)